MSALSRTIICQPAAHRMSSTGQADAHPTPRATPSVVHAACRHMWPARATCKSRYPDTLLGIGLASAAIPHSHPTVPMPGRQPRVLPTLGANTVGAPVDLFQPLSVSITLYQSQSTPHSASVSINLDDSQSISISLLPPSCVPCPRVFLGVGGSGPQAPGIRRPLWGSGVRGA